ncbi:enoyl-CoA hydratase/isomerase family protein [Mycobacterium xenopi 4042]|uniref:Enoyl-CoA hydratase/isomerase family protein n=1 Tax=Mycobacterium xenopi 4042 TaxID=1299334 RepID=X8DX21_MYCXE|nr:enoyl-CoA hydratase/isomerase family protein [Mycobacterium xenopi 4042]
MMAMTAINSGIDELTPVAGLSVTLADGVLSVIIDRPDSLNSLTTPVLAGIADAMERAATDSRVKVVRLGGAGRGFCSGAGMSAEDVSGSGGPAPRSSRKPTARCGRSRRCHDRWWPSYRVPPPESGITGSRM